MEKKFLIPQKSRDVLPSEASGRQYYQNYFTSVFEAYGALLIDTPLIEFSDVFLADCDGFVAEDLIQLIDENGNMLALRADFTLPIARIVTTKLKDETHMLYYQGSIFRKERQNNGKKSEVYQMGCELIGYQNNQSEIQAIDMIAKMLSIFKSDGVIVEIGDVRFVKRIKELFAFSSDDQLVFDEAMRNRNQSLYAKLIQKYHLEGWKLDLCELMFGNVKGEKLDAFLQSVDDDELKNLGQELIDYANMLEKKKVQTRINLGMQAPLAYYSGLMLRGYLLGGSVPFLSGGRYDDLYTHFNNENTAFGFAINMSELMECGGEMNA